MNLRSRTLFAALLATLSTSCADDGSSDSIRGLLTVDGTSHEIDAALDYSTSPGEYEVSTHEAVQGFRIYISARNAKSLTAGTFPIEPGGSFDVSFIRDRGTGIESTAADSGSVEVIAVPTADGRRWEGRLDDVQATFVTSPKTQIIAADLSFVVEFSQDAYDNAQR